MGLHSCLYLTVSDDRRYLLSVLGPLLEEFSIVASFRMNKMEGEDAASPIPLLTVYNTEAREVFGFYVGQNGRFLLSDEVALTPVENATPLEWNTNDGK